MAGRDQAFSRSRKAVGSLQLRPVEIGRRTGHAREQGENDKTAA
jgi:hypothetical protein